MAACQLLDDEVAGVVAGVVVGAAGVAQADEYRGPGKAPVVPTLEKKGGEP